MLETQRRPPLLRIQGGCLSLGGRAVFENLDLEIFEAERIGICGPTGSGKTTLLRVLAGIDGLDSGGVEIVNPALAESRVLVWQRLALFPHLTVEANVGFGLQVRGIKEPELHDRVSRTLQRFGLEGFQRRSPESLSGGERQRVALARAMIVEPKLLLLDEPLTGLDLLARQQTLTLLESESRHQAMVMVSHDPKDLRRLCSRILLLEGGRLRLLSREDSSSNSAYETAVLCSLRGE